jgi:hypothetical protein
MGRPRIASVCVSALGGLLPTTAWSVFELRMVTENILDKHPRTNDKGWSSSLGVTNPYHTKQACYERSTGLRIWMDSLDKLPKRLNMCMGFETWNVQDGDLNGSFEGTVQI